MINRLYRYTGRVLQRTEVITTQTEWVEDPIASVTPPETPPIVAENPPLDDPLFVQWTGMGFSPCITSDDRQGQMLIIYLSDGSYLRASPCMVNDGLAP